MLLIKQMMVKTQESLLKQLLMVQVVLILHLKIQVDLQELEQYVMVHQH